MITIMLRKIFFIALVLIGTIQCTQAMEYVKNINGVKSWLQDPISNRGNIQFTELPNGTKEWRKNGLLHRENDKPAIKKANGDKKWYKNGQLHRKMVLQ